MNTNFRRGRKNFLLSGTALALPCLLVTSVLAVGPTISDVQRKVAAKMSEYDFTKNPSTYDVANETFENQDQAAWDKEASAKAVTIPTSAAMSKQKSSFNPGGEILFQLEQNTRSNSNISYIGETVAEMGFTFEQTSPAQYAIDIDAFAVCVSSYVGTCADNSLEILKGNDRVYFRDLASHFADNVFDLNTTEVISLAPGTYRLRALSASSSYWIGDGFKYRFGQADLSVTMRAVPEPNSVVLLLGALAAGGVFKGYRHLKVQTG